MMTTLYNVYLRRPDGNRKWIASVHAIPKVTGAVGNVDPANGEMCQPNFFATHAALPHTLRLAHKNSAGVWYGGTAYEANQYATETLLSTRRKVLATLTYELYTFNPQGPADHARLRIATRKELGL